MAFRDVYQPEVDTLAHRAAMATLDAARPMALQAPEFRVYVWPKYWHVALTWFALGLSIASLYWSISLFRLLDQPAPEPPEPARQISPRIQRPAQLPQSRLPLSRHESA